MLHSNSLATVTDNWIVVRDCATQSQSLISVSSISRVKTRKTIHVMYLTCAVACWLLAVAAGYSKEPYGAPIPFGFLGLAWFAAGQVSRLASLTFVMESDAVNTTFGSLREAAALVAAIRSAQESTSPTKQAGYARYSWVRAYIALFV